MNIKRLSILIILVVLISTSLSARSSFRSSFSSRSSSSFGSGKSFNFSTKSTNSIFGNSNKGTYSGSKGTSFNSNTFGSKSIFGNNNSKKTYTDYKSKNDKSYSGVGSKPNFENYYNNSSRNTFYRNYNYAPPRYYSYNHRSFGMWDAMFLWFMLDHITRPDYARFYASNYSNPDMIKWRQDAERLSSENAELKTKLNTLESEKNKYISEKKPLDPNYLPSGITKDIVYAKPSPQVEAKDIAVVSSIVIFVSILCFILFKF